jgi:hypothetical protein
LAKGGCNTLLTLLFTFSGVARLSEFCKGWGFSPTHVSVSRSNGTFSPILISAIHEIVGFVCMGQPDWLLWLFENRIRNNHRRCRHRRAIWAVSISAWRAGIAKVVAQQADVCVRMNPHALSLWHERGGPFSLLESLAGLRKAGELAEWPVWIQSGQPQSSGQQRIAGRVCAIRKSRDAIARAARRLKDKQQKGKSVGPVTRKYAE